MLFLDNSIDYVFNVHWYLGTMKIWSWNRLGFFVADIQVDEYVSRISLLPSTFESSRMRELVAFANYAQILYFSHGFWMP